MSSESLFTLLNAIVLPGWLLLIVAPRWRGARWVVDTALIPLVLAVGYTWLLATGLPGADGGFSTLAGVRQLFGDDRLLLAGWAHYLAFDLFIGSWEVRDARRLGLPHWPVIPCLLLTFLAGPVGLLLYVALRWSLRRQVLLDAAA